LTVPLEQEVEMEPMEQVEPMELELRQWEHDT
jgi:hypothetical protein